MGSCYYRLLEAAALGLEGSADGGAVKSKNWGGSGRSRAAKIFFCLVWWSSVERGQLPLLSVMVGYTVGGLYRLFNG